MIRFLYYGKERIVEPHDYGIRNGTVQLEGWLTAGANSRPVFTPWAVRRIYGYSGGVPRLINAVCDKTLLCGFVAGTDRLTAGHVRRAVRELEGNFS